MDRCISTIDLDGLALIGLDELDELRLRHAALAVHFRNSPATLSVLFLREARRHMRN